MNSKVINLFPKDRYAEIFIALGVACEELGIDRATRGKIADRMLEIIKNK